MRATEVQATEVQATEGTYMGKIEDATATQLRNIETATGRSIGEWSALVQASGKVKHGEILAWLKAEHGFTHGNANAVATKAREAATADTAALAASSPDTAIGLIDAQYAGPKAHLRPLCDRLVAVAEQLGSDVEVSPKKTSVSLRRSKQFALVEVPSAKRVVLGLNNKAFVPTDRLVAAKGMCTHQVVLISIDEIDDEVLTWLAEAYAGA